MYKRLFLPLALLVLHSFSSTAQWQWVKSPKSDYGTFEAWPVVTDKAGNVFTCGQVDYLGTLGDTSDFGTHRVVDTGDHPQLVITKMDSNGNYLWAVGTQSCEVWPVNMAVDTSDNLYVLGYYYGSGISFTVRFGNGVSLTSPSGGWPEYFIAKYNPAGVPIWAKNIVPMQTFGVFGAFPELGGMAMDNFGHVFVTGAFTQSTVLIGSSMLTNTDASGNTFDIFIAKYDTSGTPLWAKKYGGDSTEFSYAAATDPSGNLFICGAYHSTSFALGSASLHKSAASTNGNLFLAKFDSSGNALWAKGSTNDANASINWLAADPWGNIYATGTYNDTMILAGDTLNTFPTIARYFLAKYDGSGNKKWIQSTTGYRSAAYGVAADGCGNIWISGYASNTFNIGGHSYSTPSTVDPGFIAQFDSGGVFHTCVIMPTGGDDMSGIAVDNRGNVYYSGDAYVMTDTLIVANDTLLPSTSPSVTSYEALIVGRYNYGHLNCTPVVIKTGIEAQELAPHEFAIFPNPATDEYTIECNDVARGTRAELLDLAGRVVDSHLLTQTQTTFSAKQLPAGVYICRLTTPDNTVTTKKFVVMH